MVVAKRQRNGKAPEYGTKENPQTRVRTSDGTNTQPNLHRQMYKRRKPRQIGTSALGSTHPLLAE